jgi:hypothetical protein
MADSVHDPRDLNFLRRRVGFPSHLFLSSLKLALLTGTCPASLALSDGELQLHIILYYSMAVW